MKPITTLAHLRQLAATDERYRRLAAIASSNLGGPAQQAPLAEHLRWLETCAMETDEQGVVDEVNFCLTLARQ